MTVAIALSLVAYSASTNLISAWENSLPENAPNNLLFNIYEGEKDNLIDFLGRNEIGSNKIYPVTSARFQRKSSGKEIDRTFNFTWMSELPSGNEIIAGNWFKDKENGISIKCMWTEIYCMKIEMRHFNKMDVEKV